MSSTGSSAGLANDAAVNTDSLDGGRLRAYHAAIADSADAAVKKIERQIAGLQETLAAKKAEAKQARAAAQDQE